MHPDGRLFKIHFLSQKQVSQLERWLEPMQAQFVYTGRMFQSVLRSKSAQERCCWFLYAACAYKTVCPSHSQSQEDPTLLLSRLMLLDVIGPSQPPSAPQRKATTAPLLCISATAIFSMQLSRPTQSLEAAMHHCLVRLSIPTAVIDLLT